MHASLRLVEPDALQPHLRCSGCSQPLVDGLQTPHGCRLCQRCVNSEFLPESKRLCLCYNGVCRDEAEVLKLFVSQRDFIPDLATRREVLELQVYCPNSEAGCEKQVLWKHLHSHLANECQFQLATCDLCSLRVAQLEMDKSHRNLQSSDCCSELRAPCPVCGDSSRMLKRQEFVEHLSTCPERQSECKYKVSVGCQATPRMSQLDEHYRSATDEHLSLIVDRFEKKLKLLDDILAREASIDFRLEKMQEKLNNLELKLYSLQQRSQKKLLASRRSSVVLEEDSKDLKNENQTGATLGRMGRRNSVW